MNKKTIKSSYIGVKNILSINHKIISLNRHSVFGVGSRIFWLKIVTALAFLSGAVLSYPLWLSERMYPLTPVIEAIPSIQFPFDLLLFFSLLVLLILTVFLQKPRPYIIGSIIIIALLALFDQSRLQPWVLHYTAVLGALSIFSWRSSDRVLKEKILNTARFIVVSIYFWSGLQKFNIVFIGGVFPWFIEPFSNILPESLRIYSSTLGLFVPFIEIGIGVGLLSILHRRYALWGAFVMMTFVLFVLGPFGHSWNSVVWPWNIALFLMAFLLFHKTKLVTAKQILFVKNFFYHKVIVLVFGILPLLSFFNLWDSYLSWALYSGNVAKAEVVLDNAEKNKLPPELLIYVSEVDESKSSLDILKWSYGELNVPPYPEERLFINIFRYICNYADKAILIIEEKPFIADTNGEITHYRCDAR